MGKNFNECHFIMEMPHAEKGDSGASFWSKVKFKVPKAAALVFHKATLVDRVNNSFVSEEINCYLTSEKNNNSISVFFADGKKKVFINGSIVSFHFLCSNQKKYIVSYKMTTPESGSIEDVSSCALSEEEMNIYKASISKATEMPKIPESTYEQITPVTLPPSGSATGTGHFPKGIKGNSLAGMDKYVAALETEKNFLKSSGGQKHKVTNGKSLGLSNGSFAYSFDLESELFLSDDAPISITNGMATIASGSVLFCEDFQIILLLDRNIGNTIPFAWISVEPWKLLDSLIERLNNSIEISGTVPASTLVEKGPSLATKKPINEILMGQENAVNHALTQPVTIIWGPPGTGKTYTIADIAIRLHEEGKKVLIVSHSNVSVDEVARQIYDNLTDTNRLYLCSKGQILRYGYIRDEELAKNEQISSFKYAAGQSREIKAELDELQKKYAEEKAKRVVISSEILKINERLKSIRSKIHDKETACVSDASIVATTISKVTVDNLFADKKYDAVIFDEVSMAYVAQVVCAATFAKKHLICVGDFMQLAPIAQSPAKDVLREDIFSFLGIYVNGKSYYHPWVVMLNEQRRMHEQISAFPNRYVYSNLIKNHPSVAERAKIAACYPFKNQAVTLIDLAACYDVAFKNADNSRFNMLSAIIAFRTALDVEKEGNSVSIIAPYRAQVRLVRALIQDYKDRCDKPTNIRCATVHQFQGSQSDVVIFDAVESYPSHIPGFLMSKELDSVKRLINVAVTRARGKLIIISNSRFWDNNSKEKRHLMYLLQRYVRENALFSINFQSGLEEHISFFEDNKLMSFYSARTVYNKNLSKALLYDIGNAKESVVISLPSGNIEENELLKELEQAKKRNVKILIKCKNYTDLPDKWKEHTWVSDDAIFPSVLIDKKITWYGVPHADWCFALPEGNTYGTALHISCRIHGKCVTDMFSSLARSEFRRIGVGEKMLTQKQNDTVIDAQGESGLSMYLHSTRKCPICKNPMKMTVGKSGKYIMWCGKCKKTELISTEEVNHYINMHNIKCPKCNDSLEARLGKNGIYLNCFGKCYPKLDEI